MTRDGSTHIVNFLTPVAGVLVLGCDHISYIVKMHYFFKNLFFILHSDKVSIVMMTKEGSNKILNFMTHGVGLLVLGRGRVSHLVKMHYFFFQKSSSLLPGIDQTN